MVTRRDFLVYIQPQFMGVTCENPYLSFINVHGIRCWLEASLVPSIAEDPTRDHPLDVQAIVLVEGAQGTAPSLEHGIASGKDHALQWRSKGASEKKSLPNHSFVLPFALF